MVVLVVFFKFYNYLEILFLVLFLFFKFCTFRQFTIRQMSRMLYGTFARGWEHEGYFFWFILSFLFVLVFLMFWWIFYALRQFFCFFKLCTYAGNNYFCQLRFVKWPRCHKGPLPVAKKTEVILVFLSYFCVCFVVRVFGLGLCNFICQLFVLFCSKFNIFRQFALRQMYLFTRRYLYGW